MFNSSELFFIYNNMLRFQVDWPIIVYTDNTLTDTHIDGHEYSIVVADKRQL